ncbi:Protein of unknown function, DUF288 [Seminavis robusta]|uniref:Uncharacterized protein n=1 Tax=Seminavis robusta TaxID=568900 RepID=A0A9N8GZM2_9STRA|nr:Protein of unknown function, DUF288 [Seminavis robusta]|eukprot:Sro6_g004810.1 Protein of unknown function, DUF288 (349) ;mRNA; r:595-1727
MMPPKTINNNGDTGKFTRLRFMVTILAILVSWRVFVVVLENFKDQVDMANGSFKDRNIAASPLTSTASILGDVITNVATSAATASRFKGDPVREFDGQRRFGPTARAPTKVEEKKSKMETGGDSTASEDLPSFLQREPLYQTCNQWAVVTTIYEPADAIKGVGNQLTQWCMVVVADTKTPKNYMDMAGWNNTGGGTKVRFLSVPAQEQLAKMVPFVEQTPYRSFAWKNIGYLYAIWMGATTIFDFDDDNLVSLRSELQGDMFSGEELMAVFADENRERHMIKHISTAMSYEGRAFNPFPVMGASVSDSWPRGMPLSLISSVEARGQRGPLLIKELERSNIAVIQDHDN